MRWITFSGGVSIGAVFGAIAGLILGGIIGVGLGGVNAHIDFCSDDGARHYIYDPVVRDDVC